MSNNILPEKLTSDEVTVALDGPDRLALEKLAADVAELKAIAERAEAEYRSIKASGASWFATMIRCFRPAAPKN